MDDRFREHRGRLRRQTPDARRQTPAILPSMASRHVWAAGVLLFAAVAWAVALFIEPAPWNESTAVVIGAGLLITASVAVVAMMIDNSRLGYWVGVSALGLMLVIAGLRRLDAFWVIAISSTALGALLMADRRLGGWIRMEGPVAPVPQPAPPRSDSSSSAPRSPPRYLSLIGQGLRSCGSPSPPGDSSSSMSAGSREQSAWSGSDFRS